MIVDVSTATYQPEDPMTSPLLLDQLAAQHRWDLLAEMRRPLPRATTSTGTLAPHARRLLVALRSAVAAPTRVASSSGSGQVCCA